MFEENLTRLFRDLYMSTASVGFEAFWPKFSPVLCLAFLYLLVLKKK